MGFVEHTAAAPRSAALSATHTLLPAVCCAAGEELRLSIDTWTEQLVFFVRNVVKSPCYVCGNSLGGLLAASFAAACPDLCRCWVSSYGQAVCSPSLLPR